MDRLCRLSKNKKGEEKMKLNTIEAVLFSLGGVYIILAIALLVLTIWFNNTFLYDTLDNIRQHFIGPFLAGGIVGYYSTKLMK